MSQGLLPASGLGKSVTFVAVYIERGTGEVRTLQ